MNTHKDTQPDTVEEKIKEFQKKHLQFSSEGGFNKDGEIEHELVEEWIRKALSQAKAEGAEEERERIHKDMLVRMKEWHGTGTAMVNDYFKALNNKDITNNTPEE